MAGKPKEDPKLTQQQEIALKKQECVRFYEKNGVKQAAADWIGRTLKTVNEWEAEDEDFRDAMLRAKATFYQSNRSRVKLDNLFANMYPDDFKPPKQEVEQNVITHVTINHVEPNDQLPPVAQTEPSVQAPNESDHD